MISDALNAWLQPYTVTRSVDTGYTAAGVANAPTTSTITIQAVIVPLNGRELERLPEGLRTDEVRNVYTTTALIAAAAGQRPDAIAVGGDVFQIEQSNDWSGPGGFYSYVARKV